MTAMCRQDAPCSVWRAPGVHRVMCDRNTDPLHRRIADDNNNTLSLHHVSTFHRAGPARTTGRGAVACRMGARPLDLTEGPARRLQCAVGGVQRHQVPVDLAPTHDNPPRVTRPGGVEATLPQPLARAQGATRCSRSTWKDRTLGRAKDKAIAVSIRPAIAEVFD